MNRQLLSIVIGTILIFDWIFWLLFYYFFYQSNNTQPTTTTNTIKTVKTDIKSISDIQSTITSTVEKALPSVVSITVTKNLQIFYADPFDPTPYVEKRKEKVWWGSWIIISKKWYILTNKHVIADPEAEYSVLLKNWDIMKVDKIWKDPVLDLAVIHIVNQDWWTVDNLEILDIIDHKSNNKIWQFVIAIWNTLAEFQNSVTLWILSAKWRKLDQNNGSIYIWLYQIDAPINPWNSWWPLLDINGQVIGINTAISSIWQWIGFSIPINKQFIKATLDSIDQYWKIKRPFIGTSFIMLNKTLAKQYKLSKYKWAFVQEVLKWSPASKVWLKKWDIIQSVDQIKLDQSQTLINAIYIYKPWDKITLQVWRDNKIKDIVVKLGER